MASLRTVLFLNRHPVGILSSRLGLPCLTHCSIPKYQIQLSNWTHRDSLPKHKQYYVNSSHIRDINTDVRTNKVSDKILTVPNLLTGCRIVLTPVLGYMVLQEQFPVAAGLFFLAGLTDAMDGQIARRWPSQRSMFGTVLDPLADKFLVSTLTVSLTYVGLIPLWLTALIIARDVGLICASFWVRYISLDEPRTLSRFFNVTHATMEFKPTTISKVNTVLQLGLVMASIGAPIFDFVNHPVMIACWYTTAVSTVLSGLSYIVWREDTYTILTSPKKKKR